jgi:hypothetical protein
MQWLATALRRGHGGDHLLAPHREDLGGRVLPLRAVRDDFRGCEERLGGAKPRRCHAMKGLLRVVMRERRLAMHDRHASRDCVRRDTA